MSTQVSSMSQDAGGPPRPCRVPRRPTAGNQGHRYPADRRAPGGRGRGPRLIRR